MSDLIKQLYNASGSETIHAEVLEDAAEHIKELQAQVDRYEKALKANTEQLHHKYKHQDDKHRCGWRVIAEAMVARSKQALLEKE